MIFATTAHHGATVRDHVATVGMGDVQSAIRTTERRTTVLKITEKERGKPPAQTVVETILQWRIAVRQSKRLWKSKSQGKKQTTQKKEDMFTRNAER